MIFFKGGLSNMFIFVGTFVLLAEDFVVVVKRRPLQYSS